MNEQEKPSAGLEVPSLPTEKPRSRSGRRVIRIGIWVLGVLLLLLAGFVGYALAFPGRYSVPTVDIRIEPSPDRVARGKALASMLFCVQCHVDPATGVMSGKRLDEIPAFLSPKPYSANITRHPEKGIGNWSDGELAVYLRTGIDRQGRLAPPWMPRVHNLADEDLYDLIAFLRSDEPLVRPNIDGPGRGSLSILGRVLFRYTLRPPVYPKTPIIAPDISDRVEYGRYVVQAKATCFRCHSASFTKLDHEHPERSAGYLGGGNALADAGGEPIFSPNITLDDDTGLGRWSEAEFVRAVREGIDRHGKPLRGPMQLYPELSEDEVKAVFSYLHTVPPLHKPRKHPRASSLSTVATNSGSAKGRVLYVKYGCRSCHGDIGVEVGDLRRADAKYATDEALAAWVRRPSSFKPGTKMPGYEGVIAPEDFPPLLSYVRYLGQQAAKAAASTASSKRN